MDLKKKIDDFRQLQAHRKSEKNKKKKKLKMAFTAVLTVEEGLPTYQANIMVTLGHSISIMQQYTVNGFPRRLLFFADDVETYDSDGNTMEINFKSESQMRDIQLFIENTEQRQGFEIAYRTLLGYGNPEDVNP